jgi:hypothetical protein
MKKRELRLPVLASILQIEALEIPELGCLVAVPIGEPLSEDDLEENREKANSPGGSED